MSEKEGDKVYTELLAGRVTTEVKNAAKKFIDNQRQEFPKYGEADLVRAAIVKYLKQKGVLSSEKNYL